MKKFKRTLALLLSIVMVVSMFSVLATTQVFAAQTDEAQTSAVTSADSFTWDNASVYFVLTDRFVNGKTSNDHSYNRLVDHRTGQTVSPSQLKTDLTTFHGGDFVGLTQKIEEGYFDDLGVNAIWMSAPYEQAHGYVCAGNSKATQSKHYAYHGYYALDYTQTDANFGTAAEFKELVDTAHEHGIRVVLDIVMNHPGYNTIYDMKEYDFGAFKSNSDTETWNNYYNWTNNADYHNTINYNSSGAAEGWAKWWGKDWLRAGLTGYTPQGGDDLTMAAGAELPDFKTESTSSVSIPTFLQTKWKKEGRYEQETSELNAWFSKTGNAKTVRNHLVYWLSEWVREYGVDGFRCDTAKHVELQSWKALSDECTKALNEWRANNKGKVEAASWTDDFWMTAEAFGAGVNKDNYYTQGGFDSKINFQFTGGGGVPNAGSINNTYNEYANKINNDPSFNVLTYISSHDTELCRNDLIYQGSAFQLLPGAIQIFYGDETARPRITKYNDNTLKDHYLRSDMNWSSYDKNVLSHWQKVGTFRKNHVAVGAGSHTSLTASSGVGFAREYNKNGVNDTVFAVINANKNTNVSLNVNNIVSDGTLLKNTYDDSTATVSGGKVTFNSGANGTILIEVAGASTAPDVSVSNTGGNFADTLSITATLNEYATSGSYKIGNAAAVNFTGSKTFTIGADMDFDETVTIKFTATNGTETKERTYKYTKIDPNATPFKFPNERTVYLLDTASWGKANCYTWPTGGNGTWPGEAMTKVGTQDGKDVYEYTVPEGHANIIFNNGSSQTDDLTFQAYSYYDNGAKKWVEVGAPVKPTTPTQTPTSEPTQKPTQKPTQEPTEAPTITGSIIRGDSSLDGKVTVIDATHIQRHCAEITTLGSQAMIASDVDGNGKVTVLDATCIQRHLVNINDGYNIGEAIEGTQPEPTEAPTTAPTEAPTTKPTQAPSPLSNKYVAIIYCEAFGDDDTSRNKEVEFNSNGTLTYDFPGNSYVFVRNWDTGIQYCTNGWSNFANPVTLINQADLTATFDKMYVPEGEHTLFLTENGDDTLTLGYDTGAVAPSPGPDDPDPQPTTPQPTTPTPSGSNTLYVDMGSQCDAYAYFWTNGGDKAHEWPGEKLEHVSGSIYKAVVPAEYNRIIFSVNGSNQTADLEVPGDNYIFNKNSNSWSQYSGNGGGSDTPTIPTPSDANTLYVDMGSQCDAYAYFWTNGGGKAHEWPGEKLENVSGSIYKVAVPSQYNRIIFSVNGSNQTGDLEIPGNNYIFNKNSNSWSAY